MRRVMVLALALSCLPHVGNADQNPDTADQQTVTDVPEAAESLEARFPKTVGDWEFAKDMPLERNGPKRDKVLMYVSRLYRNRKTGDEVLVDAIYGKPWECTNHMPDGLAAGGYEVEGEQRQRIELADGRQAEVYIGNYQKADQAITLLMTYGGDGKWIAPRIARIDLHGRDVVLRVCILDNKSRMPPEESVAVHTDLLSSLLPKLDEAFRDN